MTVTEMLGRISSHELSEWAAYYREHPFGDERADLRAGVIASTIANVNRAEGQEPYTPSDFALAFEEPEEAEPEPEGPDAELVARQLATVEFLNALFGGSDERVKP